MNMKKQFFVMLLAIGIGFGCLTEAKASLARSFVKNSLKASVWGALAVCALKKMPDSVKKFAKERLFTKQAAYKVVGWGSVGGAALFTGWKLIGSNNEKILANLLGFGSGIALTVALKRINSVPEIIKKSPTNSLVIGTLGGYCVRNVITRLLPPVNNFFGYDPHTSEIIAHHEKPVILVSHGFRGSGKGIKQCIKDCYENKYRTGGFNRTRENSISDKDIVTFDYPETVFYGKTDLGGEKETRVALWHLVQCYAGGNKKIILVCHSRGCLAMINALYMLHFPSEYNKKEDEDGWKMLGLWKDNSLDTEKINNILSAIDSVFFINPLIDLKLAKLFNNGLSAIMQTLATWFTNIRLPTNPFEENYKPCNPDDPTLPFNRFRKLLIKLERKKVTIMLAEPDRVVGNYFDSTLKQLKRNLKKKKENKDELKLASDGQLKVYTEKYIEDTNGHCSLEAGLRYFTEYWHGLMEKEISKKN